MNYDQQDTKQMFFLVTHTYTHMDGTKRLTLLRIRAQGIYLLK